MKATKDHISLETAKLLKDCGVESKYVFSYMNGRNQFINKVEATNIMDRAASPFGYLGKKAFIPAFTWQEILWEHTEEFFDVFDGFRTIIILNSLQDKDYEEADLYFREHCKLIIKEDLK